VKKTAVITGATSGVGRCLAHKLASRGFKLVVPCRSLDNADRLRREIRRQTPGAELDFVLCELSDLRSVKKCGEIIAEKHPVIDLVVANAAVVSPEKVLTPQGVELTFAVNHLAHFVLLQWLVGNLYIHSRVLIVASSTAKWGDPRFLTDVSYANRRYSMLKAYANSKLSNIACAQSFAEHFAGHQIACMSVHPGMLATNIWPEQTILQKLVMPLYKRLCMGPPSQGASVLEFLALSDEYNESVGYFDERQQALPPKSVTPAFCSRVWDLSMDVTHEFLPVWVL